MEFRGIISNFAKLVTNLSDLHNFYQKRGVIIREMMTHDYIIHIHITLTLIVFKLELFSLFVLKILQRKHEALHKASLKII